METTNISIIYQPIDSLTAAPYNPRTLSQSEFESLQRSLDEFGFVEPIVVNRKSGFIVGGHQRVAAARAVGIETVPVVFVDLDEQREKALNVALNKISGSFDNDMLAELLSGLDDDMVELTGFDENWADLLQPVPDLEDDEAKAKEAKAPKFTTDELRTLAKSLYPIQVSVILDFLSVVDERSDKH